VACLALLILLGCRMKQQRGAAHQLAVPVDLNKTCSLLGTVAVAVACCCQSHA
jgi:hypothetical protein